MKRLLPVCVLLLGLPVFADNSITLPPGGSVDVYGMTVRCTGSVEPLPRCAVTPNYGSIYDIYVGAKRWGTVDGFDNAIKKVTEIKAAGLCQ